MDHIFYIKVNPKEITFQTVINSVVTILC